MLGHAVQAIICVVALSNVVLEEELQELKIAVHVHVANSCGMINRGNSIAQLIPEAAANV